MLLGIWSGFWDWGGTPNAPVITRGGVADYHDYQKQLRKIAKAADERLYGKVIKRLEAVQKTNDAPTVITNVIREIETKIDFAALARNESQEIHGQLLKLLLKLEQLVAQEAEDELIILMAI